MEIPKTMKQFSKDEEGQGLVEYALIVALISISAIAIMGFVGETLIDMFNLIIDEIISAQ